MQTIITIFYWILVYTGYELHWTSYAKHGGAFTLLFIDFLLNSILIESRHRAIPYAVFGGYLSFTVIYVKSTDVVIYTVANLETAVSWGIVVGVFLTGLVVHLLYAKLSEIRFGIAPFSSNSE